MCFHFFKYNCTFLILLLTTHIKFLLKCLNHEFMHRFATQILRRSLRLSIKSEVYFDLTGCRSNRFNNNKSRYNKLYIMEQKPCFRIDNSQYQVVRVRVPHDFNKIQTSIYKFRWFPLELALKDEREYLYVNFNTKTIWTIINTDYCLV